MCNVCRIYRVTYLDAIVVMTRYSLYVVYVMRIGSPICTNTVAYDGANGYTRDAKRYLSPGY